jgi:hypothetical protein
MHSFISHLLGLKSCRLSWGKIPTTLTGVMRDIVSTLLLCVHPKHLEPTESEDLVQQEKMRELSGVDIYIRGL